MNLWVYGRMDKYRQKFLKIRNKKSWKIFDCIAHCLISEKGDPCLNITHPSMSNRILHFQSLQKKCEEFSLDEIV
ncbi:MAG: hypothetical protein K940chlam3_00833 [Chlamydiae bacterium]|nr:hypothetical protein [Chlamydiota bacterium]